MVAGVAPDPGVPCTQHNWPQPGVLQGGMPPATFEAAFRPHSA